MAACHVDHLPLLLGHLLVFYSAMVRISSHKLSVAVKMFDLKIKKRSELFLENGSGILCRVIDFHEHISFMGQE